MRETLKLMHDDCAEAYELRHVDDDSDCSSCNEEAGNWFKPNFELPPLSLDQEIGEFTDLVVCLKKSYKNKKVMKKEF